MDSLAFGALVVLGMVAFGNYKAGTLGDWLRAKFLNAAAPSTGNVFQPGSTSSSGTPAGGGGIGGAVSQALAKLLPPVGDAKITQPFGVPNAGGTKHPGVDFGVPTGTPVVAAGGGVVTYAGVMSGYGNLVQVDQGGGLTARYGHLSAIGVQKGQYVGAGASLGLSGATGNATGPHLHFELQQNGVPIDPLPALGLGLGSGVAA